MTESFDSTGGAKVDAAIGSVKVSISTEPAESDEILCGHLMACTSCGQEDDLYLTESITYRASFNSGVLHVYGNKDNSIDWIRCNACGHEFTMREIESTQVNFN